MQKLSRVMTDVQQYSPHELLGHAKSYGVPIGEDFNAVRAGLAQAMVEKEEERENMSAQQALLDTQKDRLVFADHIAGKGE